jgi:uncharacterized SAM-binding protein YcdF (DUF218 family)
VDQADKRSAVPPANATPERPASSRPRWRRRVSIAIGIAAGLWLVHVPLFRGIGGFLVADEPLAKADYIVILPSLAGDSVALEPAVQRVRRGEAGGLLFFQMPATRGERCGAWPDYESAVRAALKVQGIADNAIVFVPGPSRTTWQAARALGTWLGNRPTQRLDLLCPRFSGRYARHVFATVLPSDDFNRLHFGAAGGRIDETNWWRDREGIQMVFQGYVELAFIEFHGEPQASGKEWTLEQYEQSLPPAQAAR